MTASSPALADLLDEGAKTYTLGTDRGRAPAETLAAVESRFDRLGITRVANVTGLDRIGIPVHMVVRPNSRSLAVSQGKGIDAMASKVSGVMESIELHHAERYQPPTRIARYADLFDDTECPPLDPETLPLARDARYTPFAPLPWSRAVDLMTGRAVLVPLELVYADATLPELPGGGCFVRSTNGLASGNTFTEAVLGALCEVIERDAEALWRAAPYAASTDRRVDLATVDDPICCDLLARYEAAAIDVVAWDTTSDVGIASFRVVIVDRHSDDLLRPLPAAYGAGCHPRREVALTRALTEAAQSRLTTISGARDDLTRATYRATQDPLALERNRQLLQASGTRRFATAPTMQHDTCRADIERILGALAEVGVAAVAACALGPDEAPYAVARVVVAGLEGPTESPAYRPGRRALAAAATG